MERTIYIAVSIVLCALVLLGIRWMSSPRTAVRGNRLSAVSMLAAVLLVPPVLAPGGRDCRAHAGAPSFLNRSRNTG